MTSESIIIILQTTTYLISHHIKKKKKLFKLKTYHFNSLMELFEEMIPQLGIKSRIIQMMIIKNKMYTNYKTCQY